MAFHKINDADFPVVFLFSLRNREQTQTHDVSSSFVIDAAFVAKEPLIIHEKVPGYTSGSNRVYMTTERSGNRRVLPEKANIQSIGATVPTAKQ